MKHSLFDATISALDAEPSALDVETSAFRAATLATARRSFDATISALDAVMQRRQRSRGVSGDIGDCGVGITPQMCNRVNNLGDMSTFAKPECIVLLKWTENTILQRLKGCKLKTIANFKKPGTFSGF